MTFAPMEALSDGLGGLDASRSKPLSEVAKGSYNYFADGDVLLAKVTPCFENGKKAVATSLANGIGFATSEVHVLRPDPERIDRSYLRYLLSSEPFRAAGMRSMTGAGGLRRVSEAAIKDFVLPTPDLDTQKAIADVLDKETARIDQLIEKKQRLVELLGERVQANVYAVCTKGIRQDHEMVDSGIDWIGKMPRHWEVRPLRFFFAFRNEKNDPVRTNDILSLSIARGVTPYSEEGRGGNKRKDDLTAYKLAYPGDIVLNSMNVIVGAIGRSDYFGAISPVYYAMKPRTVDFNPGYFEKLFMSRGFQRGLLRFGKGILMKKSGTGKLNTIRMKVSQSDLKNLPLPCPPKHEQDEISDYMTREIGKLGVLSERTTFSIDRLKEYRSALITAAVTGQIDVTRWGQTGEGDKRLDQIQEEMAG
ncbi:restriction endonuclease subunit S [Maricaulis maris]|uniref:restriction endonuclease subunit S n=1 Tax=Maricaulis maris TaxID=74318 RepID=UPI003A9157BD